MAEGAEAGENNGGNEHVKRAWRALTVALQALSDVIDENREEFNHLLSAAIVLKMVLEDERILDGTEDDGDE